MTEFNTKKANTMVTIERLNAEVFLRSLKFFFIVSLSLFLDSCLDTEKIKSESQQKADQLYDFPAVLNYKGLPDSTTDKSVFPFFDQGAWFGFSLPGEENPELKGSFIGPFLLTQDNGVWISRVLSRLEVTDGDNNAIDLKSAEVLEISSYPGRLRQILKTSHPELLVTTELIFVSGRTALSKLNIKNEGSLALQLNVKWSGNRFLEGVSFKGIQNGVQIEFTKNDNIGIISSDINQEVSVGKGNDSYELESVTNRLAIKEDWSIHLTHTFCFSQEEWEEEEKKVIKILEEPATEFLNNTKRWNGLVTKTVSNLDEKYQDKSHQRVAVKCLETLTNNWRSPAGLLKHDGLFPSYNYKWFNGFWSWDSWKHAVSLVKFNSDLAKNQVRAMFDFQNEEGMIADCVYRDNVIEMPNWRDTKPPLSAWAVWVIYEQTQDIAFLKELYPKVEKYHQWWYKYRDHDQNGLCEYGSTDGSLIAAKWESGMDNAVRFDDTEIVQNKEAGWSMNRESVDLNAYLFAEKEYLAKMAGALGKVETSQKYKEEADQLKTRIQTVFYDKESGWFYDVDLESKEKLMVQGPEGWIPLWTKAASEDQAERVKATMLDTAKFSTYIPFPTLSAAHPRFTPDRGYWRGPIWLDQVYFAIKGLRNYGYDDEADRFTKQVIDRLEGLKDADLPIRENYHPLTGKGMESSHFSWSAAHLLMLLEE
jgi:putative isomerase